MKKVTRYSASLALNSVIVIYGLIALFGNLFFNTGGNEHAGAGATMFCFFTNDSNILLIVSSLIMCIFDILGLVRKQDSLPLWALAFKLIATVGTTLTFFTVVFYLVPVMGVMLISGYYMIAMHIINPLCALVSFICFEGEKKLSFRISFYGLLPMAVYAVIIVSLVAVGSIEPPYPFLDVQHMQWWAILLAIIVMAAGTYLISYLLWLSNNRLSPKMLEKQEK